MGGGGTKQQAFNNVGTGQTLSNNLTTNAANVYGSLEPTLAAQAAHPSGLTPAQKATTNTAAQQSAGGSTAAAIGQGRLYSARTKNAGGAKSAIGSAVRGAGENLSNAAVNTELQNAKMGENNQRAALGGLQGLNSTELSGGLNALGLSNNALGYTEYNPLLNFTGQALSAVGQGVGSYYGAQKS
jgi:hypothetical protein